MRTGSVLVSYARFVLEASDCIWIVLLFAVLGLMASVATVGGWLGIIGGLVLGGIAGVFVAKRFFFPKPVAVVRRRKMALSPGAYHWPGVERQFDRARKRMFVPVFLMMAALVFMVYIDTAEDEGWPIPFSLPEEQLVYCLLAFELLMIIPIALSARCPKCRRFLRNFAGLRQCPHCQVILRD